MILTNMNSNFPINCKELEELINENSKKIIHDYFKNKTLLFLQDLSIEHDLDHSLLIDKYIDFINDKPIVSVNICKGMTKNGTKCTHKCTADSFFCKKHIKNSNNEYQQSFCPIIS